MIRMLCAGPPSSTWGRAPRARYLPPCFLTGGDDQRSVALHRLGMDDVGLADHISGHQRGAFTLSTFSSSPSRRRLRALALTLPGHDLGGVARLELAVHEGLVARHRGVEVFRRDVGWIGVLQQRLDERVEARIHEE